MSYVDARKMDLEFDVNDWVYLNILSMNDVKRFGKKGKLSHHWICNKVLWQIGKVSYQLDVPSNSLLVHHFFQVFLLKKCMDDLTLVLTVKSLGINQSFSYKEVSIEILDWKVWELINKEVASVQVVWRKQMVEGATLEVEANMTSWYSHNFPSAPTFAWGI